MIGRFLDGYSRDGMNGAGVLVLAGVTSWVIAGVALMALSQADGLAAAIPRAAAIAAFLFGALFLLTPGVWSLLHRKR